MGRTVTARLGRVTPVAVLIAAAYALAIVAAGFLAPAYQATRETSSGEVTYATDTLVGANGLGIAIVPFFPLLATIAVGVALWQRSWRLALPFAWVITGLLAALNLISMMSVGIYLLPVTAALIVACSSYPRNR